MFVPGHGTPWAWLERPLQNRIRERCAGEGEIEVTVLDESGTHLNLSLGTGYTTNKVPVSLISAAQLLRNGALIHLERENSYIQRNNKKIRLIEKGGLLYLPAIDMDYLADDEDDARHDQDLTAPSAAFLGLDVSANDNNNKDLDGFAAGVLATPTEYTIGVVNATPASS